jgi:HK97 family phage prohead protease
VTTTDCGCGTTAHDVRALDTTAWDGPAAMSRCAQSDTPGSCYRAICAGRKAGDASLASSWALPHHKTPGGPANAAGVRNSLSRLPQTKGLTNMTEARDHLQAHLASRSLDDDHAPLEDVVLDLERRLPFTLERDTTSDGGDAGDGLTLVGHAAVFGQETEIDSWEGHFLESLRKGAFVKALRDQTPVMQFDHGRHPLLGSIPIGAFEDGYPREDDQGLAVRARLMDNWLVEPLRDAIANGTVNGMSFRFEVVRDQWTDNQGKKLNPTEVKALLYDSADRGPIHRELIEVRTPEMGPVVFPAYAGTDVSVRSASERDRDAEDYGHTLTFRLVEEARALAGLPPLSGVTIWADAGRLTARSGSGGDGTEHRAASERAQARHRTLILKGVIHGT